MPKKEVLELCENAIRTALGSLDDLPHEVANTIANVYYRYFDYATDLAQRSANNPGWIPREIKEETDLTKGLTLFLERSTKFLSDFETAPKLVKTLRKIDKREEPDAYQIAVDFILDILKYKIKDAHRKTGLRRLAERKLRGNKVCEIPNLVDLLNI